MNVLRRNIGYKLLSLGVAILLYLIASAQRNPYSRTETFLQPAILNLPTTLVVKVPPRGVGVTLNGPASLLEEARGKIAATVDASTARAGNNVMTIHYLLPPELRGLVELEGPHTVEVGAETRAQRYFPVSVIFDNTPPYGYTYRAPVTRPERVVVSGLASDVARVTRVVALLDTSEASGAIDRTVTVLPQDSREQMIDGVDVRPGRVQVALGLRKTPSTKTVVLSADFTGSVAPGHHLVGYRFSPSTVTLTGEPQVLESCVGIRVPVALDTLSSPMTRKVDVRAPAGLTLQEPVGVTLTLDIRPLESAPAPSPTPKGTLP